MTILKAFSAVAMLFAAGVAHYLYSNQRAESAANQFCDTVAIGSAASDINAKAAAAGARYLSSSTSNQHKVFFQGAIFNGFYCDLVVVDGKITSRLVTRAED